MEGTVDSGGNRHAVSDGARKAKSAKIVPRVRRRKERVADPERDQRTVFIGNLPVTFTKKQLTRLCGDYGTVSSVRFRSVAIANPDKSRKIAVFKKEYSTDNPVQNAYVVFCEQDGATKALELHNKEIEGRHISVDVSSNKGHDYKSSVFVGNLPSKVDDEAVRTYFETNCGGVDSVRLIRDSAGVGKGFGYVKFVDASTVVLALKCHKAEFLGREIRVFKAKKNPPGSSGTARTGTATGTADPTRRSFSGHFAKKGEKPTKPYKPPGSDQGKPKKRKPTQKAKEMKHFKKEKRMQSIDKRKRVTSQGKSKSKRG